MEKQIHLHNRQVRPPRLQKTSFLLPPRGKIHPHRRSNLLRYRHSPMYLLVSLPSHLFPFFHRPHFPIHMLSTSNWILVNAPPQSCLKMRKSKSKNVNGGAAPQKKGIFGMFGGKKKNQEQQYNLETAQANGFYGQQPPQAHLAGQQEGGYVKA